MKLKLYAKPRYRSVTARRRPIAAAAKPGVNLKLGKRAKVRVF